MLGLEDMRNAFFSCPLDYYAALEYSYSVRNKECPIPEAASGSAQNRRIYDADGRVTVPLKTLGEHTTLLVKYSVFYTLPETSPVFIVGQGKV